MPERLLREPHVLAHELRTPLAILAGWISMVRDGDLSPQSRPADWNEAMSACQEAVDRLNFLISQACDEVASMKRMRDDRYGDFEANLERTRAAITHSRQVLNTLVQRAAGAQLVQQPK